MIPRGHQHAMCSVVSKMLSGKCSWHDDKESGGAPSSAATRIFAFVHGPCFNVIFLICGEFGTRYKTGVCLSQKPSFLIKNISLENINSLSIIFINMALFCLHLVGSCRVLQPGFIHPFLFPETCSLVLNKKQKWKACIQLV